MDQENNRPPSWFEPSDNEGDANKSNRSYKSHEPRKRQGVRPAYTPTFDDNGEEVPLTDKQKEKIRTKAMNSALWHLEQSMKTRKEIAIKLRKKMVPEDIIEETLDKLESLGFINDTNYAEVFTRSRINHRGLGKRRIGQELKMKGIPEDIVQETLENVDDDNEINNAREIIRKKLKTTQGLDTQKRITRIVGLLMRRGYNGSTAYQLIKEEMLLEKEYLCEW